MGDRSIIKRTGGFTVVELGVAMAVILILAVVSFPYVSGMCSQAREVREMSGAKRSIAAWLSHATENNGEVLAGYRADPMAQTADGKPLGFPMNARYPYRLAPYLNYELKGSLLVNNQEKLKTEYSISVAPSFGINLTFVGGDYGSGSDLKPTAENLAQFGNFAVLRVAEIHRPSRLIVFASARFQDPSLGGQTEGYNAVKSPYFHGRRWPAAYDEKRPYWEFGNLHFRFRGKAVCAMADGHVEMLSYEDMLDMTRWSNQAAIEDNPEWTLQPM
ncbi:MAG: hypothetical protein Fur0032_12840 [Terrimicrobiaceae bacterium]